MQVINITIRLILIIIITALSFFIALITLYILPYNYRAYIVKLWAIGLLKASGAKVVIEGEKLDGYVHANHMVIANHISWLDIPILYSQYFVNFVGRAETKKWPLLGLVIRMGGTIFINRKRKKELISVNQIVAKKLNNGACVGLFPEGKTSTGRTVLKFKAPILEAAIIGNSTILPIVLEFYRKNGKVAYSVSYAGKVTLWQTVTRSLYLNGFIVKIKFLPPVPTKDFTNREQLSTYLQQQISNAYLSDRNNVTKPHHQVDCCIPQHDSL